MPITLSYDLSVENNNDRTYIRSALERFHWRRLGGSVFRYAGIDDGQGGRHEDWLNHVVPALMFFRSYILKRGIALRAFTLDASSVSMLDSSDPEAPFGEAPQGGVDIVMATPTNQQSSVGALQSFIDACTNGAP